jgi:hypothetical protein
MRATLLAAVFLLAGVAGCADVEEASPGPTNTIPEAIARYLATTGLGGQTYDVADPPNCSGIVPETDLRVICLDYARSEIGARSATVRAVSAGGEGEWDLSLRVRQRLWVVESARAARG